MRTLGLLILGVSLVAWTGCGDDQSASPASTPQPTATPQIQQPLVQQPLSQTPLAPAVEPVADAAAGEPKQPAPVRQKAAVGMGEKGRGYGGGIVTTPIKALWSTKERLVLDQIQHALEIYKATDPNGQGPKSHDEFMEQIIRANSIRLPVLPEGDRYYFDPAQGELMVEKSGAK